MEHDFSKQIGKKISITEKTKTFYVNVEDITYISCNGTVSTIHVINEKKGYFATRRLKSFEADLGKYGFLPVNRHTLVNIKYLSCIWTEQGKKYVMINDVEIAVSRRKSAVFKK